MAQKKKLSLTQKTTKKKQPLTAEVELQLHQEELQLINRELAHSQVELEAAYRQYTDLYDFAPVGYFTLMRNGVIHQVNLAGSNLLGVNHNAATKLRLAAFVSSESRPAFDIFFEKLLSAEGKETCELVLEKRGHGLLWARLEATCFEGGNVCRAMLTDITERKRLEKILQESENRFRTLLQDVSTIAVQGYAIDGTTQYWNAASEQLYGYSTQEALGQSLLDLIIPPEMRSDVWHAIQQMGETGQPIPAAELSLMRKDGSHVDVYSSHAIVSVPGRTPELFCLDVDLTERKQAEKALQQSESRYRELIELAVDGILMGSPEGIIIGANSYMLHLTGRTLNNLVGKQVNELFNLDELKRTPLRFDLLQKGETVTNERQLVRPDGKVVPIEMHTKMMPDGTYQSIYRDITERKRAEQALRESENLYRKMNENSPLGMHFYKLNNNYQLLFVGANPAADKLLGIDNSQFIGKTIEEAFPPLIQTEVPSRYRDAAEKGIPWSIEQIVYADKKITRAFDVRVFQTSPGNMVAIFAEVTERVQAQEALKQSEAQYRLLIENQTDLVVKVDNKGNFLYVSPSYCKVFGKAESDLLGKSFIPLVHSDDVAATQDEMKKLYQFPYSCQLEQRAMTKDGWRWFGWSDTAELNSNNEVVSIIGVGRDITERKQVEVELQYMKEGLETANRELQTALALQQQLAHTDTLTGINNRRHLYELAEHEFEIAARYQQPLSVIMFDIDHFKEVNDTFGHAAGDQILQRVTQVARANLRSADVIGRYGGEEFVVVLPITNAKQAYPLAERIRMGVQAIRVPTERGDAAVTLSIGIVEMIHVIKNGSAEELIRRADIAMYAAKQAGRNRTEIGE